MIAPVTWALGALSLAMDAPWWLQGLFCIPGVLWAPGVPWAKRLLRSRTGIQQVVDAAWISIAVAVVSVCLVRWLNGGPGLLLGVSGAWMGLGIWLEQGDRTPLVLTRQTGLGLAAAAVFLGLFAMGNSHRLSRDLEAWWHDSRVDSQLGDSIGWTSTDGWTEERRFGWPEDQPLARGAALSDPDSDGGTIEVHASGTLAVLLQGSVGSRLTLSQRHSAPDSPLQETSSDVVTIESDPTVHPDEGPVPRYQARGAALALLEVEPGAVQVEVGSSQGATQIYILPGRLAVDSLDLSGEARFVHYYQLLNIVENQRWASEVLTSRALTIHQPPLWSYVLAVPTLLLGEGLPTSAMLHLWVLMLLAASGLALLEAATPRAPLPAWLLPGIFATVHLKLMLFPGSINFPDSLYAAAMVGGVASLLQRDAARITVLGLASGLLRYPGTIALTIFAVLLGRAAPWRGVATMWAAAAGLAALLALCGLISGDLSEWIFILWFETVPEHYSNNPDASPLWLRPVAFYRTWFMYMGGALLFALPLASRRSRWIGAAAFSYSLMLCTIDHLTTHYFLPLIALSAVAIGANSEGLENKFLRILAPLAALLAGGLFIMSGTV